MSLHSCVSEIPKQNAGKYIPGTAIQSECSSRQKAIAPVSRHKEEKCHKLANKQNKCFMFFERKKKRTTSLAFKIIYSYVSELTVLPANLNRSGSSDRLIISINRNTV